MLCHNSTRQEKIHFHSLYRSTCCIQSSLVNLNLKKEKKDTYINPFFCKERKVMLAILSPYILNLYPFQEWLEDVGDQLHLLDRIWIEFRVPKWVEHLPHLWFYFCHNQINPPSFSLYYWRICFRKFRYVGIILLN